MDTVLALLPGRYHPPIRLSTVIHAPVDRVTDILEQHEQLTELLDNHWLSLTIVDPTEDNDAFQYDGQLCWRRWDSETTAAERRKPVSAQPTADD